MAARHLLAKFIEIRVVEEQLGYDEISAGIDFFAQVLPIYVLPFFASDMAFGKPSHTYAKIVHLANKFDELVGVFKATGRGLKLSAPRRIAAQSQNILDP